MFPRTRRIPRRRKVFQGDEKFAAAGDADGRRRPHGAVLGAAGGREVASAARRAAGDAPTGVVQHAAEGVSKLPVEDLHHHHYHHHSPVI